MKKQVFSGAKLLQICTFGAVLAFGSSAYAGESWDLAGDWNPPANPNGAWTYGDYNSNVFVSVPYMTDTNNNVLGGGGGYVSAIGPNGYIYLNLTGSGFYGIGPGQVALDADVGTPVVRWTAPVSGFYDISVMIGGTTAYEGGGTGNNFAQFAGVNINMVGQAVDSFTTNVMSWMFTNMLLSAGTTVDAYVAWPGYALGGNTQTIFHVDAVQISSGTLTISYASNSAIVSWSSSVTNQTLQTNADLASTNWGNYGGTITTLNDTNSVSITPPVGNLFFRLGIP